MATVGVFHWYVHLKGPTKNWPICLAEYAVRVAPFCAGSQTRTALVPCCGLLLTVRGASYLVGAPQETSRAPKGHQVSLAFAPILARFRLSSLARHFSLSEKFTMQTPRLFAKFNYRVKWF